MHWVRSLVSAGVVAVAAGLLIAVLGTYGSLTGSVERLAVSIAGNANYEIVGVTDSGFDQSELDAVRAVPGVETAVPLLRSTVRSDVGDLTILGVDSSITALQSDLEGAVGNASGLLTDPDGVLVGAATGLTQGDTVTIDDVPTAVVGVVDGPGTQRIGGGMFAVALVPTAQALTDRTDQLDSIFVLGSGDSLRTDLDAALAGRVSVMDPDFRADRANQAMSLTRNATLMVSLIAFVVAAFLVFNVMNMAIAKRRPTISLLRAVGGRRGDIVRDLLFESVLVGLVGGAVGVPLGIVMGRIAIESLPPFLSQAFDARIEYVLPGFAIPVAIVACVLACVGASAVAAVQVYRISPIEALAVGGGETSGGPGLRFTLAATVFGVFAVAGSFLFAVNVDGQLTLGAGALFMFGVVALCVGATGPIVSVTAAVPRRWGGAGRLATATIERAPRRIWATVMTIVIAVGVSVGVSGSLTNMTDSAAESLSSLANTDLYVSMTSPDAIPSGPIVPAEVEDAVRATPGVSRIVEGQWAYATIDGETVSIQGVADGSNAVTLASLSDDVRAAVLAGDGVVLSEGFGRTLGVSVGDSIDLPTPTGVQTVRVLDLVEYINAAGGTMAISLDSMQRWYDRPGATYLEISIDGDVAAVQDSLRAALPPEAFVYTGGAALEGTSAAIRQSGALAIALQWIVALVAAVALLNTLTLSVLERRRELGVLRAMGGGRGTLARMVLAEALSVGVVGGVLGLIIGAGLQYLSTLILGASIGIPVAYTASWSVLLYGLVALGLSLLGSAPPAVHASRLSIVDAIAAD
ncbi:MULTISPECIES: FtsX-like permease family protein [unclassified Rhodococcus (in: high G+C Gram-positive bacteria)]|uniref:FtsX-like permease family protein n=1 Tax=unclassified Rhodococcus (in: high G+C Gram-positive bacteria) TaxID=192944 RepID=UPI0011EBBFA7|nr:MULTISPECIES: FtsX-like permease family protein [unclassified Rhodococcus (in: high G+C Gram-positive bacteria)]KAA0927778.1 FtsX-like permease family protein [Rhodococcus sp. ANT_H53B]MDI9925760.1 FtsX-like permease family protein [Rhodococcus sp. IEGM 1341]